MHTKAFFCAALFAGCAHAAGDPADPRAEVPDPRYESVFASYRGVPVVPLEDWARLNAVVGGASGPAPEAAAPEREAGLDHGPHRH